jgi:N-acylneuraminate cytidylyltransferase
LIKKIALEQGVQVIDRPSNISGDLEPTITALQHVLQSIDMMLQISYCKPTNPLRPEKFIERGFAKCKSSQPVCLL